MRRREAPERGEPGGVWGGGSRIGTFLYFQHVKVAFPCTFKTKFSLACQGLTSIPHARGRRPRYRLANCRCFFAMWSKGVRKWLPRACEHEKEARGVTLTPEAWDLVDCLELLKSSWTPMPHLCACWTTPTCMSCIWQNSIHVPTHFVSADVFFAAMIVISFPDLILNFLTQA